MTEEGIKEFSRYLVAQATGGVHSAIFEYGGGYMPESLIAFEETFQFMASCVDAGPIKLPEIIGRWRRIAEELRPLIDQTLSPRSWEAMRSWYGRILIRDLTMLLKLSESKWPELVDKEWKWAKECLADHYKRLRDDRERICIPNRVYVVDSVTHACWTMPRGVARDLLGQNPDIERSPWGTIEFQDVPLGFRDTMEMVN